MHIRDIRQLYDYNVWANHRLLDQAAQLAAEQLRAPTAFSFGSLFDTLAHTLGAEWMWRTRLQEGISPPALLTSQDFSTLADLRARWDAEEQNMRAFLASLRDDDLERVAHYTNTQGVAQQTAIGQALLHLVLHGMQHRSESAAMLTSYGHSPGWIDYIFYLREQQAATPGG
jgi:uncharacterized damage-inducible protein DinB